MLELDPTRLLAHCSAYAGQASSVDSTQFASTSRPDTMGSAASGSPPAAATKWTPPSCLARYCTHIKNRIADFFDWVCSLFCSSKAATLQQIETALKDFSAFRKEIREEDPKERYPEVTDPSESDAYRYLADHIEGSEIENKFWILLKWKVYQKLLTNKQKLEKESVITERQLRSDMRQLKEIAINLAIFTRSDLPKETTTAMIEKVKAFSLGKLTCTIYRETASLVDIWERDASPFPPKLSDKTNELIKGIRKPMLEELNSRMQSLATQFSGRYQGLKEKDFEEQSRAVYALADCIAVREVYDPLKDKQGDISKESLDKRIEMLKKCLARPVVGEATREMYKKVKEFNFEEDSSVVEHVSGRYTCIEYRLNAVIAEVQEPQKAQTEKAN